jgi:hypothetical protein
LEKKIESGNKPWLLVIGYWFELMDAGLRRAEGRRRMAEAKGQMMGFQVSGVRFQVSGVRHE